MRYRILMIGTALDSKGGISQLLKMLVENWPENNFELRLLVTHEDGSALHKVSIFLKSIVSFVYLLISDKPDIVHAHFSINASIFRKTFFVILAKLFRRKVLLHSHTGEFERYMDSLNVIVRRYLTFALNLADGLIILGSKDVKTYQKYYWRSLPIVLRNPMKSQTQSALLKKQQIITVGTLGYRKGTYDLLDAIPKIHERFPQAEFLLVGDGDLKTVTRIIEQKCLKNIRLTGWQKPEEIRFHLERSSIFVLPSYYEGMPIAILEAMSFGLPVVSTAINGIPDVVIQNETGILVEPGDVEELSKSIINLLASFELRIRMGQQGKSRIDSVFSVSKVLQELMIVYENLVWEKKNA